MGHDIYGFQIRRKEIAYLRRGAFDRYTNLYRWLHIEEHGAGDVSGDGTNHLFTADQIKEALEQAHKEGAQQDEIAFLESCLQAAQKDGGEQVIVSVG